MLMICGLFLKGRVLAQDEVIMELKITPSGQTIVKPTALAQSQTQTLSC